MTINNTGKNEENSSVTEGKKISDTTEEGEKLIGVNKTEDSGFGKKNNE